MMTMTRWFDRLAFCLFSLSVALLFFGCGVTVGEYKVFPYRIFSLAIRGLREVLGEDRSLYYKRVEESRRPIRHLDKACQGVNLVTRVAADRKLAAEILDMNGRRLHAWDVNWFKIWPDSVHLPKHAIPRSEPGTHLHGAIILENGDLIFNYDHLGLVRLGRNGEVMWRLPYQTHHSIHQHDDGNLWVCGQRERTEPDPHFPHRSAPFDEYTILEVTPQGEILQEWSIPEILLDNDRAGLLHLNDAEPHLTVRDDRLHLNDVEPFPSTMEEGLFKKGDILVSLRNIHTVFVFNREDGKIKFLCTGWFMRQHDPDFIDGNTFSVFDNHSAIVTANSQSRVMIVSARDNTARVFFEGSPENPFFTDIMGKHQWLPNGNLLITESCRGRAFEIDRTGEIVWEYINYVEDGTVGLVDEVQRLSLDYARFYDSVRHTENGHQLPGEPPPLADAP